VKGKRKGEVVAIILISSSLQTGRIEKKKGRGTPTALQRKPPPKKGEGMGNPAPPIYHPIHLSEEERSLHICLEVERRQVTTTSGRP